MMIDTRYNGKIRYNDNFTGTKPALKSGQVNRNYSVTLYLILHETDVLDISKNRLIEAIRASIKIYVLKGNKNKIFHFLRII